MSRPSTVRSRRLRPIASSPPGGIRDSHPSSSPGGALGPGHEKAPNPDLPAAAMSMLPRPCLDCGQLVRGKPRCWDCQRAHDRQRGTRQERGYDAQHDALRRHLVAALDPWAPCPRCGHPLGPDPALLDLMHNDQRTAWLGLGHRACNRDVSPQGARPRTPRPPKFPTHTHTPRRSTTARWSREAAATRGGPGTASGGCRAPSPPGRQRPHRVRGPASAPEDDSG
jgi:hypothetical protein